MRRLGDNLIVAVTKRLDEQHGTKRINETQPECAKKGSFNVFLLTFATRFGFGLQRRRFSYNFRLLQRISIVFFKLGVTNVGL